MDIYKKIILILIIAISSYIIYRLIQKQQRIINTDEKDIHNIYEPFAIIKEGIKEGATNISNGNLISDLVPPNSHFPLNQYCIMGSFNSAYTGSKNTITNDAVNHILKLGCRFLDFEIYLVNGIPVVAISNDPSYITISSSNSLDLQSILQNISTTAMNSKSCNNSEDPLFIQLRIKSQNTDIYGLVAVCIANTVGVNGGTQIYNGQLNNLSPIDENLQGKYIFIMDSTINPNWKQYPNCSPSSTAHCNLLTPFINMTSGSDNLRKITFDNVLSSNTTNPHIFDDGVYTDVSTFQMAVPKLNSHVANPPYSTFIINYGIQIALYPFYINDTNLTSYIAMFNTNESAFVPISTAINYYNKINSN
jgi:hypothetical protein